MYIPNYFFGSSIGSSFLILIPGIALMLWAQWRVKSVYNKYSQVPSKSGMTSTQAVQRMLWQQGLNDVGIDYVGGQLTDRYDPITRVLSLAIGGGSAQSIAAIGVAAHEVGHAVQHANGYLPLRLRTAIFPVVNVSSMVAIPLLLLGFYLQITGLVTAALILYASMLFFQLVTLPVEYDASRRARLMLADGILAPEEVEAAGKVLNAAALTYLSAALVTFLQLVRFMNMTRSRR